MKAVSVVAVVLTIIGGINWGLVGLGDMLAMNLNVVNLLVGAWPIVEQIVYLLVGLSALLVAYAHATNNCGMCTCGPKEEGPAAPPEEPAPPAI